MADMEAIAAALNQLLDTYGITRDQMADLLSGSADGGPNGDGRYPVTLANGTDQILVPSPARTAADVAFKLDKSGGALTGDLGMGGHHIYDLAEPFSPQDAATKAYVDAVGQILAGNITDDRAASIARDDIWQVQFLTSPIVVDVPNGVIHYPRFRMSREGEASFVVDPVDFGMVTFANSLSTATTGTSVFHYIDVALAKAKTTGANPILQKTAGSVLAANTGIAPLGYTGNGNFFCRWASPDQIIWSNKLPPIRLSLSGPEALRDDVNLLAGGLEALYFPIGEVYSPLDDVSYGMVANPPSTELLTHCKVVLGDGSTAQAVIFNVTTRLFSVVDYPNLPALLVANPGKIKLVLNRWGQTFESIFEFVRISTATRAMVAAKADKTVSMIAGKGLTGGGDLGANRTFAVREADDATAEAGVSDQDFMTARGAAVQRDTWQFQTYDTPIVIDVQGGFVYYGKFVLSREGSAPKVVDPAAYGLASFKQSLGTAATAVHHYVDMARIDTVTPGISPIQQKTGGAVASQRQRAFPLANSAFGKYFCYWSNNVIRSDELPATRLSISGPLGFRDDDNLYGGGVNAIYLPLGSVFDPVENVSYGNVANPASAELPTHCKLVMGDGSTAQAVIFDVATLTFSVVEYPNLPALLIAKPGKIKLVVNRWGQTFQSIFDLGLTSVPTPAMITKGAGAFVIPPKLFLYTGRPLTIFPENMLHDPRWMSYHVVSTASSPGMNKPPLVSSGADALVLDPARMGTTLLVSVQQRSARPTFPTRTVAVSIATSAPARSAIMIGDSRVNRGLGKAVRDKYADAGGTLTLIGSMTDTLGAPSEGREGWQYADYTHENARFPALAVGQESAYLAMTYAQKNAINPFIRVATGSDPVGIVKNGYVFDFAFYLSRFSYAVPNRICIVLGVNDINAVPDAPAAAAQVQRSMALMYTQIRAAAPSAGIAFGAWATGSPNANGIDYGRSYDLLICTHIQYVATTANANLAFLALYMHENRRADWPLTLVSTDANGVNTTSVADALHEDLINKSAGAETVMAWVAA